MNVGGRKRKEEYLNTIRCDIEKLQRCSFCGICSWRVLTAKEKHMDVSKDYVSIGDNQQSDAAIILLLGSGGSNALTKGVSKWLIKQGVNV